MAYNIVLDREVNGKWQLPENCRVVAAGNSMKDSLAANQLAEPLFNRFAHTYIETDAQSWLEWATTPDKSYERMDYEDDAPEYKIHPAICAYIAWKGDSVLRTDYNGEKPNADPRKWEMASKVLSKTKQPAMLRALVGEDITYDFSKFCELQVITLDDVLEDNYTDEDLNMETSQKFATALAMSFVEDENIEKVRGFVKKLGPEIRATFDSLWINGSEERVGRIQELTLMDQGQQKTDGGARR